MGFILLLGGARSGKSALAVRLGVESGSPVTFFATAAPGDDEMANRILRHREDRPSDWTTIEAPLDLLDAVTAAGPNGFLVIDCLTLWVSNLLAEGQDAPQIVAAADLLTRELAQRRGVVVSNEVGLGIVPANDLARSYRNVLGSVNMRFAECAERSILMVAGRAVELTASDTVFKPT